MRGRQTPDPDPVMLTLLDLHSQGYTPREACETAEVPARYSAELRTIDRDYSSHQYGDGPEAERERRNGDAC